MKRFLCMLLSLLLLSGCGAPSPTEPAVTQMEPTLPEIRVQETMGEAEVYREQSQLADAADPEQEVLLASGDADGMIPLGCLLRNETQQELTIHSVTASYYRQDVLLCQETYGAEVLAKFLLRMDARLNLTPGDSTLLMVTSSQAADLFNRATCAVTLQDETGVQTVCTFRFTTDESQVTPPAATRGDGWDPVIKGQNGWIFFYFLENTTTGPLHLEAIHNILYRDGVPCATQTFFREELEAQHLASFGTIAPGEVREYSDGISLEHCNYDQRESTFVYRDENGTVHTQVFHFLLSEENAVQEQDTENGVVLIDSVADIPAGLGTAAYSAQQIRDMAAQGLSLDEAAEKISTVADLAQYLHECRFGMDSGDLQFEDGGVLWSVNRSAQAAFGQNQGNTGGGSNLVNCLLRGDYEEQGYVHEVTYRGGHIYNYFKCDGVYYFLDLSQSMNREIYDMTCFRMHSAPSLESYAAYRAEQNHQVHEPTHDFYLVMTYAYPYDGNHRPLGAEDTFTLVTDEIRDTMTLLYLENDTYAPEFAAAPPMALWPAEAQ